MGKTGAQPFSRRRRELKVGDVVDIPAEVKHWHGAAKDSWFAHLAIEVANVSGSNEWCEEVVDDQYDLLP